MAIMTKRIKQCHDTTLTPPQKTEERKISRGSKNHLKFIYKLDTANHAPANRFF